MVSHWSFCWKKDKVGCLGMDENEKLATFWRKGPYSNIEKLECAVTFLRT